MTQPDLLIVGAGPVGLTLACEAVRHGLTVRIVDQRATASIHSKAQIVHARTLEMLEDMGIADRFLERGGPIHSFTIFEAGAKRRIASVMIGKLDSHYQGLLSISQHHTEVLLAERLAELGVEVEREVRLEGFTQDDEGVTASLVHDSEGSRTEEIRVPWLAGCDGAHSTVRHALDLDFDGHRYPMHIIQADARVDLSIPVRDDEVIGFAGVGTVVGLFPLPGEERRYRFLVPGNTEVEVEPTLEQFQAILDEVGPPGSVVSDPHWMVGFRIHCRMTPTFHVDRAFLCGDAGHIHSPAGGQGMNMGMQDAYNLAWKLALFHKGEGTQALLASYSTERVPVARSVLDWTDSAMKGALVNLGLESTMVIGARNQIAGMVTSIGLVQHKASRLLSMLDVSYDNSPVCGEHQASLLQANVVVDPDSEAPSLRSWYAFSGGPRPGQRAPEAVIDMANPAENRLHQILQGTGHTLLLFDGAAATAEGYANLAAIGNAISDRYGDRITTHIVVPGDSVPEALDFDGSVIQDAANELHETYCATTECLYLIRPDGYVGFRSQPASLEALQAHLALIFS